MDGQGRPRMGGIQVVPTAWPTPSERGCRPISIVPDTDMPTTPDRLFETLHVSLGRCRHHQ
jgi:hypothetical protein